MQKPPTSRIVNGYAATDYVPWQVSIQYYFAVDWYHLCGGTILDEKTILTASHCYYPTCFQENCRVVAGCKDQWNLTGQVWSSTVLYLLKIEA